MFEGKPPHQGTALPFDQANAVRDPLRPVSWSDLVAKLDAARDLRAALNGFDHDGEASFDRSCARHIASLGNGKQDVNLDALANGKAPNGKSQSEIERGSDQVRGK